MEQVLSKLNFTSKLKRYSLLPLMAMSISLGGIASAAPSDFEEIKNMDAETVSKHIYVRATENKLSEADKKEALKAFQKEADKAKFPNDIKKLVTMDTILDHDFYSNGRVVYAADNICIVVRKTNGKYGFPTIALYDIQEKDIAEPLPPVSNGRNTVTKKPYFSIPKNLAAQLSPTDKEYFKTLYKVLNTNFGTMMIMPTLSESKISKNGYAGKLIDMPVVLFGDKFPMLEKEMGETEIAIRRKVGFLLNGALEMKKAGAKLFFGTAHCTGWKDHGLILNEQEFQRKAFTVPNGIYNAKGLLSYSRTMIKNNQIDFLRDLQSNFQDLLRENGVEPGTNPKQAGLTPKQQILVGWYNAYSNYTNNLFKTKFLGGHGTFLNDQKLKTSDSLIGPENTALPKEFKIIPPSESSNVCISNFNKINLASRGR